MQVEHHKNQFKRKLALLCSALLISSVIPAVSFNADAAAVQSSTIPITAKITAKVNLQKSADKTAAAVKVLPKNTNITILEVVNAEWYYVKTAGGALGYCSSEFVDITTDAKSLTATKIYSDSSVKDTVIKTAAPGMTLDITAFLDNNWAKVLLEDGTSGYVECSDIAYVSGKIQSSAAVRQISETAASDITLFENSVTVMAGSTKKLVARYASGTVLWTSSDDATASVSATGTVKGIKGGKVTVTATDTETGKSAKCLVTVKEPDFTSVSLDASAKTVDVAKSFTLKAVTVPATSNKVKFKSSDTSVATVDANGKVTGVSVGTATITAYDSTNTVTADCKVTVTLAEKITLSQTSVSVNTGSSVSITAKTLNASTVLKWTSSNSDIASVSNGKISGLKAGTATITVSNTSGTVKAACKVTVKKVSSGSLSVSHSTRTTNAGKTIYIKGYGSGSWETSDSSIATVSRGFIYCKKPGKVSISYKNASGQRAVCTVTVTEAAPIRFAYSSPNSATINSNATLVAITDKTRSDVKFVINVGGKNVEVKASSKTTDGNTLIWKGTYKTTAAGTFSVKAYSFKDGSWKTCSDGSCDLYVTSKTKANQTGLDTLRASDNVIRFIGEKEGFVSEITYDTLANNIPTIGYGYVVWTGNAFYNNMTKNEAFALLIDAVNNDSYTSRVNAVLQENHIKYNQQQFDALVSFSYNLGTGWTYSSDLKNILLNSYDGTKISGSTTMTATVNADALNLRQSATTSSNILEVLPNGSKVTLLSTTKYNSVWYKVKTSSGKTGYCSGTYLNISSSGGSAGRNLNSVNKNALIKELLSYHHAGSVCYYGLLYRRVDELEMFLYNDYTADGRSNQHHFPSPSCLSF